MKIYAAALALALALPGAAQAAEACTFQPPSPALQAQAYPQQTFVRKKNNGAAESAQVEKDVRLEILHSQCVDTLVTEYTLVLPRPAGAHDLNYWLDFAAAEMQRLKTSKAARDVPGLLAFLKKAHGLKPAAGKLAICKDGTAPVDGECDFESLGGYIFKVDATRNAVRITITDYASA
ncbi:hypothetical protein [Pseudoduganella aquatica]|uniref:hypothetical protein n=1 Tax=Pseudoduganella aquatica TaxID=2660641 RepID=UPI001E345E8C|nr:hypothetical protein [Pseudoduganella aquatica]